MAVKKARAVFGILSFSIFFAKSQKFRISIFAIFDFSIFDFLVSLFAYPPSGGKRLMQKFFFDALRVAAFHRFAPLHIATVFDADSDALNSCPRR
jgi:hypothetical protein